MLRHEIENCPSVIAAARQIGGHLPGGLSEAAAQSRREDMSAAPSGSLRLDDLLGSEAVQQGAGLGVPDMTQLSRPFHGDAAIGPDFIKDQQVLQRQRFASTPSFSDEPGQLFVKRRGMHPDNHRVGSAPTVVWRRAPQRQLALKYPVDAAAGPVNQPGSLERVTQRWISGMWWGGQQRGGRHPFGQAPGLEMVKASLATSTSVRPLAV